MHQVTVTAPITLTDGQPYTAGTVVFLSEDEFQDLTQLMRAAITDNGEVVGPYSRAANTSALIIVERGARRGVLITNTGTTNLLLAYGPTVSLTLYSVSIAPNGYWSEPVEEVNKQLTGIWSGVSTGGALVTVL